MHDCKMSIFNKKSYELKQKKIPYILTIRKRLSLEVDKTNRLIKPSLLNSSTSMTSLTLN